jgi:hypothetical protein
MLLLRLMALLRLLLTPSCRCFWAVAVALLSPSAAAVTAAVGAVSLVAATAAV